MRHVTTEWADDVLILRFLAAKISEATNADEVGDELDDLLANPQLTRVLLDLDGVEFLSSAALNRLILMDQKLRPRGGKVKICSARPEITEVLQITRLDTLFELHPDVASGLASYKN